MNWRDLTIGTPVWAWAGHHWLPATVLSLGHNRGGASIITIRLGQLGQSGLAIFDHDDPQVVKHRADELRSRDLRLKGRDIPIEVSS